MQLSAHLNLLFRDEPLADRIDQVAAAGYDGFEVYGFDRNLHALIEKKNEHGLEWIYLSGNRPNFTDPARRDEALESIERSLAIADEAGCRIVNVKSGSNLSHLDFETKRQSVVDVLDEAAPMAENRGITLALEPLNTKIDHPDHFTETVEDGVDIVDEVDSAHVKILFDFYHEQVASGDIIRTFEENVDQVGHVHVADNPGRHEPGTGEINYANVFETIRVSGYEGYVGCEFVPTGEPALALSQVRSLAYGD